MFVFCICGTNFFGACHAIKGLGNVQTTFFHIYYIPLCCPITSYFIVPRRKARGGPIAIKIPLDLVSVGKAYLRGGLCLMAFVFGMLGIVFLDDGDETGFQSLLFFVTALLFGGAACETDRICQFAKYGRAKEIGRELGSRRIADLIDRVYNGEDGIIQTVLAEYYDELVDCMERANNDYSTEAGVMMVEAEPIREESSSSAPAKRNPLVNAVAVTESDDAEHERLLPVALAVVSCVHEKEKDHDEKEDTKHEYLSASMV